MNSIRVGRRILQALRLFVSSSNVAVSRAKAQKNKIKSLIGLFMAVASWSLPSLAQRKNEVGLVIGGIVTPSQTLSPGASLIGPTGAVLPNRNITFDPSLTLGAEYDRAFVLKQKFAIDGGVDFLAQSSECFAPTANKFKLSPETLSPDGNLISWRLCNGELEQGARLKPRSVCCMTELSSPADRRGHLCRQRALMRCVNGQCSRAKALSGKRDCI